MPSNNSPPNYTSPFSSSSSKPPPTTSNGGEGIKFKLNIESLSLDANIPLGSNLGVNVSVPPGPYTNTQPSSVQQNAPSTSNSHQQQPNFPNQPIPSTPQSQPQAQNQAQPNFGIGPETILLGLATSLIQRLEKVERDLEDERRINREYRNKIDMLQERLRGTGGSGRLKDMKPPSVPTTTEKQPSMKGVPPNKPYNLNPPPQTTIPTSLNQRTTPQRFDVNQVIEPDEVDEIWQKQSSPNDRSTSNEQRGGQGNDNTHAEENDDDDDDPTGLGLDDDQAILYGFKPRSGKPIQIKFEKVVGNNK